MQPPCANPVEMWPIDRPKPNPDNARIHPDSQVLQIAKSIQVHGLNRSLVVDEGDMMLAGHGLLLALRYLGYQEVPVQVFHHLSPAQKRTFLIADNQIGLNSAWDDQKLRSVLEDLEREVSNLDVIGFPPQELDRILADLAPEILMTDPEEVPEVPKLAVTIPGDVWLLRRHRLFCGDGLLSNSLERVLQGELADMAFSDPPYNVNYLQKAGRRRIINDDLGPEFEQFLEIACAQLLGSVLNLQI